MHAHLGRSCIHFWLITRLFHLKFGTIKSKLIKLVLLFGCVLEQSRHRSVKLHLWMVRKSCRFLKLGRVMDLCPVVERLILRVVMKSSNYILSTHVVIICVLATRPIHGRSIVQHSWSVVKITYLRVLLPRHIFRILDRPCCLELTALHGPRSLAGVTTAVKNVAYTLVCFLVSLETKVGLLRNGKRHVELAVFLVLVGWEHHFTATFFSHQLFQFLLLVKQELSLFTLIIFQRPFKRFISQVLHSLRIELFVMVFWHVTKLSLRCRGCLESCWLNIVH